MKNHRKNTKITNTVRVQNVMGLTYPAQQQHYNDWK
jgi:hypothetical protein